MTSFEGTPTEIGQAYGTRFRDAIMANLRVLVWREGYDPLPRRDPAFRDWVGRQEAVLEQEWPWLLEEIKAVAVGCGAEYPDILLLNLRAWQYDYYGRAPTGGCSSLAVTLADGTVACAGALDDGAQYYCGAVRFAPTGGLPHISFPITGTSWGNRGLNSRGLAVGISSRLLPGLRGLPHAINQDLAVRAMLQTCDTVGQVRDFCQRHPFTMNLVCVDTQGAIFCAHQTAAGLFELPTAAGWCALTNHIVDDGILYRLSSLGVQDFFDGPTSRARRGRLMQFCRDRNGACSAEEVMNLIGWRDDADPGSIHNDGTIALTFSVPQSDPRGLWVWEPQAQTGGDGFQRLEV